MEQASAICAARGRNSNYLSSFSTASDIAVVGNFTGAAKTASVAAVGANSPVIGLLLNLFIGIALGTNVIIANAIGRDDRETVQRAVHTSVLTAIIGGFSCNDTR